MSGLERRALLAILREARALLWRFTSCISNGDICEKCHAHYWKNGTPAEDGNGWTYGFHEPDCSGVRLVADIDEAIETLGKAGQP